VGRIRGFVIVAIGYKTQVVFSTWLYPTRLTIVFEKPCEYFGKFVIVLYYSSITLKTVVSNKYCTNDTDFAESNQARIYGFELSR
jgi:hypothetical protein